jgi:hypothetical protein
VAAARTLCCGGQRAVAAVHDSWRTDARWAWEPGSAGGRDDARARRRRQEAGGRCGAPLDRIRMGVRGSGHGCRRGVASLASCGEDDAPGGAKRSFRSSAPQSAGTKAATRAREPRARGRGVPGAALSRIGTTPGGGRAAGRASAPMGDRPRVTDGIKPQARPRRGVVSLPHSSPRPTGMASQASVSVADRAASRRLLSFPPPVPGLPLGAHPYRGPRAVNGAPVLAVGRRGPRRALSSLLLGRGRAGTSSALDLERVVWTREETERHQLRLGLAPPPTPCGRVLRRVRTYTGGSRILSCASSSVLWIRDRGRTCAWLGGSSVRRCTKAVSADLATIVYVGFRAYLLLLGPNWYSSGIPMCSTDQ